MQFKNWKVRKTLSTPQPFKYSLLLSGATRQTPLSASGVPAPADSRTRREPSTSGSRVWLFVIWGYGLSNVIANLDEIDSSVFLFSHLGRRLLPVVSVLRTKLTSLLR